MTSLVQTICRLGASRAWRRGVEFALVAPALAMLAAGLAVWGGYYALGCRLQGIADMAAAAAAAGGAGEAEQAARKVVMREVVRSGLSRQAVAVFVERREGLSILHLAYEARRPGGLDLSVLLPAPPRTIVKMSLLAAPGG